MPVTFLEGSSIMMNSPRSTSSSDSSINVDKVTQYEHFLNDVLRTDLKSTLTRRDKLYADAAQYLELQTVLEKLSAASAGDESFKLKTKVDIGSNFYVQAEIPNTKTYTIEIGCGVWLPMNSKDASAFCNKKLAILNARIDELTQQELNLKAQINIVLEGLKEIQKINYVQPRPRYE
jgi:prefoldin subunit 5